jgi:hypothetical protein
VAASDDLVYVPRPIISEKLPSDLIELSDFIQNSEQEDLLSHNSFVLK